jgi:hypothetical protein
MTRFFVSPEELDASYLQKVQAEKLLDKKENSK